MSYLCPHCQSPHTNSFTSIYLGGLGTADRHADISITGYRGTATFRGTPQSAASKRHSPPSARSGPMAFAFGGIGLALVIAFLDTTNKYALLCVLALGLLCGTPWRFLKLKWWQKLVVSPFIFFSGLMLYEYVTKGPTTTYAGGGNAWALMNYGFIAIGLVRGFNGIEYNRTEYLDKRAEYDHLHRCHACDGTFTDNS